MNIKKQIIHTNFIYNFKTKRVIQFITVPGNVKIQYVIQNKNKQKQNIVVKYDVN